jgi:ubiquinone/menaquinone biosynthesis C-methylase UbiE
VDTTCLIQMWRLMVTVMMPLHVPALDRINRRTFRRRGVLRQFETASDWLEPGEKVAIAAIVEATAGGPILDIGVGGGRTAPLLLEISNDYRGIDYLPEMVETARRRFPSLQFQEMDARELTFADRSFRLVTFSYNGIDSVDMAGRLAILREVHRVLVPGGYFVFSSLNRFGVAHSDRWPDFRVFREVGRSPARIARALVRFVFGGFNWMRFRLLSRTECEVAIGTISAHNFGLITMFMSVKAQIAQLRECGFSVEAVIDPNGTPVTIDTREMAMAPWYYFVARRSASSGPLAENPTLASAVF